MSIYKFTKLDPWEYLAAQLGVSLDGITITESDDELIIDTGIKVLSPTMEQKVKTILEQSPLFRGKLYKFIEKI